MFTAFPFVLSLSCRTVLLLNSSEVSNSFISVAEKMSGKCEPARDSHITLIKHMYQAAFGVKYNLNDIQSALEVKKLPVNRNA